MPGRRRIFSFVQDKDCVERTRPSVQATTVLVETVYSGIDRFSGTKTSDDEAILFTANDSFSGNDRYSGTKSPDRFFHYNGHCL